MAEHVVTRGYVVILVSSRPHCGQAEHAESRPLFGIILSLNLEVSTRPLEVC